MNMRLVFMVVVAVSALAGCKSIGPRTVTSDRFDYNTAISDSWKEQTLLNIVKIRYADMPLFIEVASIVAGYTMETEISAGASFPSRSNLGGDTFTAGASGRFTDRPTITYAPITGQQFNRSFMTPIPPQSVLFLMQSGWPVDLVFPIAVDSMNGLQSEVAGGANERSGDSDFYRAIKLLRQIQNSGAVGMRIKKADEGEEETTMIMFHRDRISPELGALIQELDGLLDLNRESGHVRVIYSGVPEAEGDLAMLTRSMLQIMVNMALLVEVPKEHAEQGRTPATRPAVEGKDRPMQIHSSLTYPSDAFTAVRYRDHWFYIDDRDFKSKRTFTFLMVLFSLTETGGRDSLPLVTIPAG